MLVACPSCYGLQGHGLVTLEKGHWSLHCLQAATSACSPLLKKTMYNAHGSFALPLSSHKVAFKVQWEEGSLDIIIHDTVGFIISIFPSQE